MDKNVGGQKKLNKSFDLEHTILHCFSGIHICTWKRKAFAVNKQPLTLDLCADGKMYITFAHI